jgi:hypothetical protein
MQDSLTWKKTAFLSMHAYRCVIVGSRSSRYLFINTQEVILLKYEYYSKGIFYTNNWRKKYLAQRESYTLSRKIGILRK